MNEYHEAVLTFVKEIVRRYHLKFYEITMNGENEIEISMKR